MKKKGFTLIELLAVIVILAIIALIATPIIMNVIENSKKGAAERSYDNYLSAVNTLITVKRLDGIVLSGTYTVDNNGDLCSNDGECITVEMNGTKPINGIVIITDGQIGDETTLLFEEYMTYNKNSQTTATESICRLLSGENYEYGQKYICNLGDGELRNFYLLEDGDTTTLTKVEVGTYGNPNNRYGYAGPGEVVLIMDRNYTDEVMPWCDPNGVNPENNDCNADGLSNIIQNIRKSWLNLSHDKIGIPTVSQLSQASENSSKLEPWLLENIDSNSSTLIPSGYWTASKSVSEAAYRVREYGKDLQSVLVTKDDTGVRPVIIVNKLQLG